MLEPAAVIFWIFNFENLVLSLLCDRWGLGILTTIPELFRFCFSVIDDVRDGFQRNYFCKDSVRIFSNVNP